jgi:gliding motility-associated-like protein
MYKAYSVNFIVAFAFLFIGQNLCAQLSKTHYIPPLTSASFGNANPEGQYIYLSTPSATDVGYTIMPIGLPAGNITGVVSNATPVIINIGTGNGQLFIDSNQTSTVQNKGYVIESQDVIYVSVRMQAGGGAQAGALVSKGASALGKAFRVGSYTNENPQDNYLNFVSVMATEDATQVVFDNLPAGLIIKNYTGTTPVSITLNKHESFTIATNSFDSVVNRDGIIGCLVTANKDIVVNCGSANGSFHNGGARDYGMDQIVGASKIGDEYIFVQGDGSDQWENILIVAHFDNTSISINGNAPVTTINAGQYYLIEGNNYSPQGNMYVNTSNDVFVYQGVGATTSEANQGMFFVPPLSCEARGNLNNIAQINEIGAINYTGGISVVTKVGATITINNLPLSNFNTIGPNPVTGNLNYETYKVTGLVGDISVQSDDELYCAYYNFNGAATSGSFYSGFPSAPEINFDVDFISLGNCIPNITLSAANTAIFDTFQWLFDDGSGFVDLSISTPEFTPVVPGIYKLVGIVTCSGLVLESVEVPISICPDDADNDGIIDNIDIDNDNDGILNCAESNGDVILDISNTNQPQLLFNNGAINSSLATGQFTQSSTSGITNTFTGTTNGNFISTVNPAATAQSNYEITFTEAVHVLFSEDTTLPNSITDGAYFVIKVLQNDRNITLQDPDNKLLIDTDFDGVFESNVNFISGSEIHFKFNTSPTGTIPYTFSANTIEGISFTHHLANVTSASVYRGNLSLTCFKRDTDADGVEDAFDLDTDNDGIPDIIESLGNNNLALSGIDVDNNGLDDVFNSNSLPIDTDTDMAADYMDLDSDNDGIYDLFETDQQTLLLDADFNGIVDGTATDFGTNGWIDAAETSPDSGLISYILNDVDGDLNYSYLDSDSDGDGCSDVIEAGFSDVNADDFLGDNPVQVNTFGIVTNATDGYTLPNSDYLISAPLSITNQSLPIDVCELDDTQIVVASNTAETFQWETSADGVTWNTVTDNAIYSGSQTATLSFSTAPLGLNGELYRVFLNRIGNSCGLYSNPARLTVHPLPIVISPVTLIQCDDDTDGFSDFNLNEVNNTISSNASNETFSFYLTENAALTGDATSSDFITNSVAFTNQTLSNDVVWARITSAANCSVVSRVQLQVSTTTIPATFLRTFNVCDDFLDLNGNDTINNDHTDGVSSFDFGSVTAAVLALIPAGQNPLPPRYYRNEADALAEVNEITDSTNYRNIGYPGTQQIYIRIDSAIANDCLGLGPYVTLNVEALPIANPVSINRQCDDDQDGLFPFDVSQIETSVLNGQSRTDVMVTYFDSFNNPLSSPLPNPFVTGNQTIRIRLTNTTTADPNGPCFNETTLEFVVDQSPTANPVIIPPFCDNDGMEDGLFSFDTSTFQTTILQGQTGLEVRYFDAAGVALPSPLPHPFLAATETITAQVINPLNLDCIDTSVLHFVVHPLPQFTIGTSQVVCLSSTNLTALLDPQELDTSEIYTYQWVDEDGTILSNAPTLIASTPGTYTITLTKTDGTTCSQTKTVTVNASEFARITLNDISIVEMSDNNSITINTANNNLGLGNYEFALDDDFGWYQDRAYFENIAPGIHVLYVRDKNGCGTTSIEFSIIGYPRFFTPNADGFHDTWQIRGINSNFNSNSLLYIFDRYGKLLKQLDPLGIGWDGTFNGQLLPSSDYWFKLSLQDGSIYSGHFTLKR